MHNNKTISIPPQIKTMRSHFNYQTIWHFLHNKGMELYGASFSLLPADAETILKLVVWFIQDKDQVEHFQLDLSKGILLLGPVGCGKSCLMNICRFLLASDKRHSIKSCRDVSFEFAREGYDSIQRYTKGSFSPYQGEPKTYCFDDLGSESKVQFYGNDCSVMAEIILSRYEFFHAYQMLTHITTNLNSTEIENRYGLRVRSRMRELFNLIAFQSSTPDKRK